MLAAKNVDLDPHEEQLRAKDRPNSPPKPSSAAKMLKLLKEKASSAEGWSSPGKYRDLAGQNANHPRAKATCAPQVAFAREKS